LTLAQRLFNRINSLRCGSGLALRAIRPQRAIEREKGTNCMKKVLVATLLLSATVAFAKNPAQESKITIKEADKQGVPTFVVGEVGRLGAGTPEAASKAFLKGQKDLLQMVGTEDFEAIGTFKDGRGDTHVRLQERLRGLPVVGAEYIVHSDATGNVKGLNGRFSPDRDLPRNASIDGWAALTKAAAQAGIVNGAWQDMKATLLYVVNDKGNTYLAWRASVASKNPAGEQLDRVYADATTGNLVVIDPQYKRVRNRQTYTLNNGTTLPGTLVLTETTGSTTDSTLQLAHNYAGATYQIVRALQHQLQQRLLERLADGLWRRRRLAVRTALQGPRRRCARAHACRDRDQRQPRLPERVRRPQ
jgi:Zn-dependent metalloprotease